MNITINDVGMDMAIDHAETNIELAYGLLDRLENLRSFCMAATPTRANLIIAQGLADAVNLQSGIEGLVTLEGGVHGVDMPDMDTESLKELPTKAYRAISNFINMIVKSIRAWFSRITDKTTRDSKAATEALDLLEEFGEESDKCIDEYKIPVGEALSKEMKEALNDAGKVILMGSNNKVIRWDEAKEDIALFANIAELKKNTFVAAGAIDTLLPRTKEALEAIESIAGIGPSEELLKGVSAALGIRTNDDLTKYVREHDGLNEDYVSKIFDQLKGMKSDGKANTISILGGSVSFSRNKVAGVKCVGAQFEQGVKGSDKVTIRRVTFKDIKSLVEMGSDFSSAMRLVEGHSAVNIKFLEELGSNDSSQIREGREALSKVETDKVTKALLNPVVEIVGKSANIVTTNGKHLVELAKLCNHVTIYLNGIGRDVSKVKKSSTEK